ncbi:ATP-binding protein [Streptomyces sp. NPDC006012]|uniref:ATP-binding protein n=1 Tax=Streptomyces sp. NPDC006012 TaxID=3364739 RepID=UPI0036876B31
MLDPFPEHDGEPSRRVLVAEDGSPVVSVCLPREAASVPAARRLVRRTLADWDLPDLVDAAELIVSELASNAVRHARHGVFRLTIRHRGPGTVRVEVIDKCQSPPVRKTAGAEDDNGRGLALVEALSERWGTEPLAWGKRVWADVAPDDAPSDAAAAAGLHPFATTTVQIIYVLTVVALVAWLGVLIADGPR